MLIKHMNVMKKTFESLKDQYCKQKVNLYVRSGHVAVGADKMSAFILQALSDCLDEFGLKWTLNPGDGAFYGPKVRYYLSKIA